jgi:hypothetical protein
MQPIISDASLVVQVSIHSVRAFEEVHPQLLVFSFPDICSWLTARRHAATNKPRPKPRATHRRDWSVAPMAFVPDTRRSLLRNPVWLRLGAVLLILVLGALFFVFASARSRHGWLNRQAPPDNPSTSSPAPIVPH